MRRSKNGSFDHFVDERQEIRRQFNTARLGGFQIDYERIARGLLERPITWMCGLGDPGDQVAGSLERGHAAAAQ